MHRKYMKRRCTRMHHLSFSGKILKKWLLQTCVSSYCSIALHYDNLWQIKLQRSFVRKWNIFFVELNVHIVRMVLEIQWYELRLLSLYYTYKFIGIFFTFWDLLLRLKYYLNTEIISYIVRILKGHSMLRDIPIA